MTEGYDSLTTEESNFKEGVVVVSATEPRDPPDGLLWLDTGAANMAQDVSITTPITAFSEVAVAEPTPIAQIQFPYNINPGLVIAQDHASGTVTQANNLAVISTGAAANSSGVMLSRVPLRYNPGQGGLVRFTSLFTAGVANSTQYGGVGDPSDGYFFGYNGTAFGIMRRSGGQVEIRTLTVTTKSTTAENITITLDGDSSGDVVAVTDATATDATTTANEIAAHDYSSVGDGWDANAVGDTVIFISHSAGSKSGSYTLSGATTAVGSFASTIVGVSNTEVVVAQSSWSEDVMDGTGTSGITLDQTKGNVYQIRYQWLGFGMISFWIENPANGRMVLVHRIEYANAETATSVNNPTLPLYAASHNTSNTSDVVMKVGSMSAFVEGKTNGGLIRHGTAVTYTGIGTTETPLFTLRTNEVHAGTVNRVRLRMQFATISVEAAVASTIRVKINGVLTGASFSDIETGVSVAQVDTSATSISGGREQLAVGMAKSDSEILNLTAAMFLLNPGDTLTVTGQATASTVAGVASFNWEELF